jgi:hypothetical protein
MIWTLPGFSAACIPVTARPITKPVKMTFCTTPTLRFILVVNSYFGRNKEKNGSPPGLAEISEAIWLSVKDMGDP